MPVAKVTVMNSHAPSDSLQAHASKLFRWGLVVSVAYLGLLSTFAWWRWPAMTAMKPNEVADFLAGAFAPLAFLWLVLGFRQQGDELQNSVRALRLQGEELRNSVEQQRQLVEVSREQLKREMDQRRRDEEAEAEAAQPQLMLFGLGTTTSGEAQKMEYRLENGGPTCTAMKVRSNGERIHSLPIFKTGATCGLSFGAATYDRVTAQDVVIEYVDVRGFSGSQRFHIPVVNLDAGRKTLGVPIRTIKKKNPQPPEGD